MASAPSLAAESTDFARSANELLVASTRMILQFGHAAETMSTSSDSSSSHSPLGSVPGSGLVLPCSLTFWKHLFLLPHAESPNSERYTAISASAFGSS